MFLIICSADPLENHLKYKYLLLLVVLSDAKIGLTHGKDLALGELGEETKRPVIPVDHLQEAGQFR